MINAYTAFGAKAGLQPYQYDPGELKPNEVEIDVMYCGICHSDLSMIDNEWQESEYPLVPGHEVVGKVSALGSDVSLLQTGQLVGLGWHRGYCNECYCCTSGDHNLCSDARGTIVGHHGGFADKVRADANSVIAIPEGVDPATAGPLFCGGITVYTPMVEFDFRPNSRVAVIGIGGLGHLALKFLNAWGCEVTAFTSSESKREEALSLGAHHTLNSRDSEQIKQAAGRFDAIISTVNVRLDWNLYLNTLSPRGRLHFVGVPLESLDIRVDLLIGGQRSVSGSPVGSPKTIKDMLEFARRHNIQPEVEMFSFDQVNEAIARLRSGKAHYRVVLDRSQGK